MADSPEATRRAVGSDAEAAESTQARQFRYRVAFFLTALIALGIIVTLPFSVKSVVDDVLGSATGRVVQITPRGSGPPEPNHTKLHLAVTSIDEVQLLATIRVSGHHRCPGCTWKNRVLFVAVANDDADADGLPPSAAITLAPNDVETTDTLRLPLRGHPIHYPFDHYRMVLGVAYQRMYPDGKLETLTAAEARGRLFLSLQELLPRNAMEGPFSVDPGRVRFGDDPFEYASAFEVRFARPTCASLP